MGPDLDQAQQVIVTRLLREAEHDAPERLAGLVATFDATSSRDRGDCERASREHPLLFIEERDALQRSLIRALAENAPEATWAALLLVTGWHRLLATRLSWRLHPKREAPRPSAFVYAMF